MNRVLIISENTVGRMLKEMDYSLQSNVKWNIMVRQVCSTLGSGVLVTLYRTGLMLPGVNEVSGLTYQRDNVTVVKGYVPFIIEQMGIY